MKKITVLTATRAEYGLLRPLIQRLRKHKECDTRVVVTGMHLSPEFGMTFQEIEQDGIPIDRKIEILLSSDSASAMSKSMGLAMISFADYFEDTRPDAVVVLGDRFETLAVCCAAMNANVPILHLHGGEATEGVIDEAVRHAITKMSYLHFTSTEAYRKRVIQLGEHPERVYNVGAIGVENIKNLALLDRKKLQQELNIDMEGDYALITYHPVTLEENDKLKLHELFDALASFEHLNLIFTKANADANGRYINQKIEEFVQGRRNAWLFDSLGVIKYLSAVKCADMVVGNSSSGIVEAPYFGVPTINIGDRQRGRIQAPSIINCELDYVDICRAMQLSISREFRDKIRNMECPYGDGHTSEKIVQIIDREIIQGEVDLKKNFYDIEFEVG